MQFESLSEFLNMGGYGFYVWLSYGSGLLLLLALGFNSTLGNKKVRKQIQQRIKREEKLKQAAQAQKEQS